MNDSTTGGLDELILAVAAFADARDVIDAVASWRRGGTAVAVTRRLKAYAKKAPPRAGALFAAIDAIRAGHSYRAYACLADALGNYVTEAVGPSLVFSVTARAWLGVRGAVLEELARTAPTWPAVP